MPRKRVRPPAGHSSGTRPPSSGLRMESYTIPRKKLKRKKTMRPR